jgi:hypothetical protein
MGWLYAIRCGRGPPRIDKMSPLSPRYVALPAAALAIIVGLAQARGQGTGQTGTLENGVHQVTSCTAPANTLVTACAVADAAGATVMR